MLQPQSRQLSNSPVFQLSVLRFARSARTMGRPAGRSYSASGFTGPRNVAFCDVIPPSRSSRRELRGDVPGESQSRTLQQDVHRRPVTTGSAFARSRTGKLLAQPAFRGRRGHRRLGLGLGRHPPLGRLPLVGLPDRDDELASWRLGGRGGRPLDGGGARFDPARHGGRLGIGRERHDPHALRHLGKCADDVWAVGELGTILHWNGAGWSSVSSETMNSLYGVWGSTAGDVWTVGGSGTVLHHAP